MYKRQVVLNSIVNIPSALSMLNKYSQICCHLDNDKTGRMATWQIMKALGDKCTDASNEYEEYKDLNEYLMNKSKMCIRDSFYSGQEEVAFG